MYVAVSVLSPGVVKPSWHLAVATEALHVDAPSVTETLPVGATPEPVTLKLTITMSPGTDGLGDVEVIAIAAPLVTWCWTGTERLPLLPTSPEYCARRLRAPGVVSISWQEPAATVPEHVATPSVTDTVPVAGAPPCPDWLTIKLTVTGWPGVEGVGEWPMIVVVVEYIAECETVAELGVKVASPS